MFAYPLQVLNFAVVYFMQQSFVSTAPTYGDSQAKVQGNYFLIVPAVPGNYRGFYIRNFTPVSRVGYRLQKPYRGIPRYGATYRGTYHGIP